MYQDQLIMCTFLSLSQFLGIDQKKSCYCEWKIKKTAKVYLVQLNYEKLICKFCLISLLLTHEVNFASRPSACGRKLFFNFRRFEVFCVDVSYIYKLSWSSLFHHCFENTFKIVPNLTFLFHILKIEHLICSIVWWALTKIVQIMTVRSKLAHSFFS